jgi:AcrR family transcriptional regulator
MAKQGRSTPVIEAVIKAVEARLMTTDETLIRIPDICEETGVNYGSVYHHFGSREGVIDAAYINMFNEFMDEDIAFIRESIEEIKNSDDVMKVFAKFGEKVFMSEDRALRRMMRARIVAASFTRPQLKVSVGLSQNRVTNEISELFAILQDRGVIKEDLPAHSVAVTLQGFLLGRVLDDISINPLSNKEFSDAAAYLFLSLVKL